MSVQKLTARQYLKLHPDKFVMVTYEFGEPIYIAPLQNSEIQVTLDRTEAEKWGGLDNSSAKLSYHAAYTGYKMLMFERI